MIVGRLNGSELSVEFSELRFKGVRIGRESGGGPRVQGAQLYGHCIGELAHRVQAVPDVLVEVTVVVRVLVFAVGLGALGVRAMAFLFGRKP
ncbi:hypothetical protein D3C73_1364920 [compost metagenome]